MADKLANRLSSVADSLRSRGMPPPQSSANSEESTSETVQRLFPSTRGRNSGISGLGNQRPVPSTSSSSYSDRHGSRGKAFKFVKENIDANVRHLEFVLSHVDREELGSKGLRYKFYL